MPKEKKDEKEQKIIEESFVVLKPSDKILLEFSIPEYQAFMNAVVAQEELLKVVLKEGIFFPQVSEILKKKFQQFSQTRKEK